MIPHGSRFRNRRATLALAAAVSFLLLSSAARAATWTEIPSSTTTDITAIEYQGADRFWFATGDGKIFRRVAGVFQLEASDPTTVFRDIEFQDGGQVGFAVGTNGAVWRSPDGGDSWTKVTGLVGGRATEVNRCDLADQPLGDVDSVRFGGPARAWIVAAGTQIFRTVAGATAANVGSAAAGWQYINDNGADCKIDEDMDDLFPLGDTGAVYFIGKSFGGVWFTANGLDTSASKKTGDGGNGFQQTRRLVGDPANPNRQWSVQPYGEGISYTARTIDGWNTGVLWKIGNPDKRNQSRTHSVDFAGGSVLAAGSGGMILHSIDGETFFFDDATGAVATNDWLSVSAATANDAAVGGALGKLVVTSNLATVPDILAPTGTIAGPTTAAVNTPVTFTAQVADEAGGSGINPASLAWTTPGLTGQSGPSATFTFPNPGTFTVTLAFADVAGNATTATKSITISRPAAPAVQNPTLAPASSPPVSGKAARRKGRSVIIRVNGRLGVPAGVNRTQACTGVMSLSVYKGKKRLVGKTTAVRSDCVYKKTIKVRRRLVGRAKRLKLKVAFKGNAVLAPLSSTYSIKVKR